MYFKPHLPGNDFCIDQIVFQIPLSIPGFSLGLAFDGIVGKAYAKTDTPATNPTLPEG